MIKINLHDIVIFKANPNSGEMVVTDIKDSYRNFPHASSDNPVIFVKFWDKTKKEYNYDSFYSNHLKLISND